MATFSYFQHYPHSLLDPLFFPKVSAFIDLQEDQSHVLSLPNTSTFEDTSLDSFLDVYNVEKAESSALKKHSTVITTGTTGSDQLSHGPSTTSVGNNRPRKTRQRSNFKEGLEGECKKQKSGSSRDIKKKRGSDEELSKDFIHVRARRGQATDSHSLAERVRREKISEKMKTLQNLVPGCDKVTGKALMLDEIINYVQSLQNQVEFLSMKLTSISPMVYDFGLDLDGFIHRRPEEETEERDMLVDRSGFNSNSFCSFPN